MVSLLRTRVKGEHARVGFVELFFDLVFVFAITQISHLLIQHPTPLGALEAVILLAAVWWNWIYTSWVTNWLDVEQTPVRLALFVIMAAGLVMSIGLPDAFGGRGLVFACAFVAIHVGRSLFMLWAAREDQILRQNFQRILCWTVFSGVFWIVGGFANPEQRLFIWLAALAVEYAGPALSYRVLGLGRASTADWTVEGAHLAERVGLFVIICLGETLLVTGATFAELPWTLPTIAAFASSFLTTIAMWQLYFAAKHDAASDFIAHSEDAGAIARRAYTYAPIVLIAGIIVSAVGDEFVLVHPLGHAEAHVVAAVLGGPAIFLFGSSLAAYCVWGRWSLDRLMGSGLLVLLAPPALMGWAHLSPLWLSLISSAVLIAVAVWEALRPQN
jgi:low temperature requirement protein LtrA